MFLFSTDKKDYALRGKVCYADRTYGRRESRHERPIASRTALNTEPIHKYRF